MDLSSRSALVKLIAREHGFDYCGISKVEFLEEEAPRLDQWLSTNKHGEMKWMEAHYDMRLNPALLVPGAKSVISLLFNYFTSERNSDADSPKISTYAYGEDYHHVIKDKLKSFIATLKERIGEHVEGRVFVDSAPVMDKVWAKKSGLGWVGKNSNLITRHSGSFFFIAEAIVDMELEPDGAIEDFCGTCTKCIDACPTDAISEPYVVDGSKCISYFTIELKGAIPESEKGKFNNWIFGCDICQDVCPWNRFAKQLDEPRFQPHPQLLNLSKSEWEDLSEQLYQQLFRRSAVKRTKFEGLKRNLRFVTSS